MSLPPDLTGPGFRLHHPHRGWLTEATVPDFTWRNGATWRDAHVFATRALAQTAADTLGSLMAPGTLGHLVAAVGPGQDARRWSVSHWPACAKGLRTGRCRMDDGHRGRCSTVAFYCDWCGEMRRGRPWETGEVDVCWFCLTLERPEYPR